MIDFDQITMGEDPNNEPGSVSDLLLSLKDGNSEAELELWNRYFPKLCSLARAKLGAHPRRISNEEDIAVSVFELLYRGAKEDRFRKLQSRLDLWRLLVIIASNKVKDKIRKDYAKKRGGGVNTYTLVEDAIPESPAFEDLVALQDTCEMLMNRLEMNSGGRKNHLSTIAKLRLEGYSKAEVANRVGVTTRTIERKLNVIYEIWVSVAMENY